MERPLNPKKGPQLYQQELADLPAPQPQARPQPLRLPLCEPCQRVHGNTLRIARPGGRWACGRGHGLLNPPA